MLRDPVVILRVLGQVGPRVLIGWFLHYAALGLYTLLHTLLGPFKPLVRSYHLRRLLDAFKYGSASDYEYAAARPVSREQREAAIAATTVAEPCTGGSGTNGSPPSARGRVSDRLARYSGSPGTSSTTLPPCLRPVIWWLAGCRRRTRRSSVGHARVDPSPLQAPTSQPPSP